MAERINYLIEGHKKFWQKYFEGDPSLYQDLVKYGQQPKYIVVACSDSRVDPSIIMNCEPGDLFVIRNVANLIPPCELDSHYHGTSAALEFGICNLKIQHVIILGHSQCGGITSLVERNKGKENQFSCAAESSFLSKWMEIANPACEHTLSNFPTLSLEEQADHCGKTSILNSLENLHSFSWIEDRIKKETLYIHGWYFDLGTGKINVYNPRNHQFEVLGK